MAAVCCCCWCRCLQATLESLNRPGRNGQSSSQCPPLTWTKKRAHWPARLAVARTRPSPPFGRAAAALIAATRTTLPAYRHLLHRRYRCPRWRARGISLVQCHEPLYWWLAAVPWTYTMVSAYQSGYRAALLNRHTDCACLTERLSDSSRSALCALRGVLTLTPRLRLRVLSVPAGVVGGLGAGCLSRGRRRAYLRSSRR